MKRCPICGTTYPDRVDFCFSDGAPLVTVAEVVQRAPDPVVEPKAPPRATPVEAPPAVVAPVEPTAPLRSAEPPPAESPLRPVFDDEGDPTALVEPVSLSIAAVPRRAPAVVAPEPTEAPGAPLDAADLPEEAPARPLADASAAPAVVPSVSSAPSGESASPADGQQLPGLPPTAEEELPGPVELPPVAPPADPAPAGHEAAMVAPGVADAAHTPELAPAAAGSPETPDAPVFSSAPAEPVVEAEPPRRGPVRARPVAPEVPAAPEPAPPRHRADDEGQPIVSGAASGPAAAPRAAEPPAEEDAGSSRTGLLVVVALISVLIVVLGGWWLTRPPPKPAVSSAPVEQPAVAPRPAPVAAPVPAPVVAPVEAPPAPTDSLPAPAPAPAPASDSAPAVPAPAPAPSPAPSPAPAPSPTPAPAPAPAPAAEAGDPWGASAPAQTTGKLTVTSTPPGALVFIDNQEVGRTPLTRELPFGSHAVRAELPNFKPASRSLRLAGAALTVALELQPAAVNGTLFIVGPAGSRIKMDGQDLGASPATVSTTEGSHSFEVVLPDGSTRRSTRSVQFAAQSRATIEL